MSLKGHVLDSTFPLGLHLLGANCPPFLTLPTEARAGFFCWRARVLDGLARTVLTVRLMPPAWSPEVDSVGIWGLVPKHAIAPVKDPEVQVSSGKEHVLDHGFLINGHELRIVLRIIVTE